MWRRLLSMYTNINLLALLFYPYASEQIRDIMRASTLLILIVAASIWPNAKTIYPDLFNSFSPGNTVSLSVKYTVVFIFDMVFHVLPVILIGLPHNMISYFFASVILFIWYRLVRHRINEIYSRTAIKNSIIGFLQKSLPKI